VSHQLRTLEASLAITLLEKGKRKVSLTQAGEQLAIDSAAAFGLLHGSLAKLERPISRGNLCVGCVPAFLSYWMMPRLETIRGKLPGVEITFVSTNNPDRNRENADVSILYGTGNWPDRWFHLIAGLDIFPVISPTLAGRVSLRAMPDLDRHVLLHSDDGAEWRDWLQSSGVRGKPYRQQYLPDAQVSLEAAINGQGVALGDNLTARHALDTGRLIAPFAASIPANRSLFLVCSNGVQETSIVRAFLDWLVAELNATTALR
jgi:LysR family glycine cleavage system transcriptional activator